MAALDYLRRAGLAVEASGDRLRLSPPDRVTPDVLQFVRDHRTELLADLSAANDAQSASAPPQAPAAPAPAPTPTPAPAAESAPEAASEPRRTAWPITRGGKPIGYMVGQPITYAEALAEVRCRWHDADILEN